ncbi:MAG: hypothetical protein M1508_05185 [Nitrospirae bacterium]|nr:hypothetical protein [Nitrospirota bacterium]
MVILGLNAYHGDSSACIVVDGQLIAAAEEERFTRIKHWAGLPTEAIKYCLDEAKTKIEDIDHIAVNRDPKANFLRKAFFAFSKRPSLDLVKDRLKNASKIRDIKSLLSSEFNTQNSKLKTVIHNVEHHIAHLASSLFVSPFEEAAVVSVDGFGDFVGAMWGEGRGGNIDVKHRTFFPHKMPKKGDGSIYHTNFSIPAGRMRWFSIRSSPDIFSSFEYASTFLELDVVSAVTGSEPPSCRILF